MKDLFTKLKLGNYELKNRVIMAPMTRSRAVEDECVNDLIAQYYAQRASAGLIITEATQVSPMAVGYPCTPGLYKDKHIEAWKKVTSVVHEKGGLIFAQLWHVGRVSHSSFLNGALPEAPSPIKIKGEHFTFEGMQAFETPRELTIEEIKGIVEDFANAANNAIEAGFDGVEIHGANGYLIDQFIKDGSNQRTDSYGGSIENRSRFLFEILNAVITKIGEEKTALRLSPSGTFNDMSDTNPEADYKYICTKLNEYNLAYLHIIKALDGDIRHGAKVVKTEILREVYKKTLILNGGYTKEKANKDLENNLADAIAFASLFISNPDLPKRLKEDLPLATPDPSTFYTQDAKGFTDYEFIDG